VGSEEAGGWILYWLDKAPLSYLRPLKAVLHENCRQTELVRFGGIVLGLCSEVWPTDRLKDQPTDRRFMQCI